MEYEILDAWSVTNIFDFIRVFDAAVEFGILYNMGIEDWDFDDADGEVIGEILKQRKEKYFFNYCKDGDYFNVYILELVK